MLLFRIRSFQFNKLRQNSKLFIICLSKKIQILLSSPTPVISHCALELTKHFAHSYDQPLPPPPPLLPKTITKTKINY